MKPNEPRSPVYTPPRPNRGPEPWDPPRPSVRGWMPIAAATFVGTAALGLVFMMISQWLKRHQSRRREAAILQALPPGFPRWTYETRRVLTEALGESWRTKTTEEMASSGELTKALGDAFARETIQFFRESDRARFSANPTGRDPKEDWSVWIANIKFRLAKRKAENPGGPS